MTSPLMGDGARRDVSAGLMLTALEAELLEDDPEVRGQFAELAKLLRGWQVASDQAVAVRLRLLAPGGDGYTDADLTRALADYRFARGLILSQADTITRHQEEHANDD
jgi:hypothetical protein